MLTMINKPFVNTLQQSIILISKQKSICTMLIVERLILVELNKAELIQCEIHRQRSETAGDNTGRGFTHRHRPSPLEVNHCYSCRLYTLVARALVSQIRIRLLLVVCFIGELTSIKV